MPDSTPLPKITTTTAGHGWLWLRDGYRLYRRSPLNWLVSVMVVTGMLLLSFIPMISLLVQITLPGITAGLMLAAQAQHRGEPINPGYLIAGFKLNRNELLLLGVIGFIANTLIMILATILFTLFTDTSIMDIMEKIQIGTAVDEQLLGDILSLAMLLLILTMPLIMALWFSPALVILNKLKAWDAFKLSFLACHRNIFAFITYGLIGMGYLILITLPIGFGFAILTVLILLGLSPVIFTSIYCGWRDIFTSEQAPARTTGHL